MGKINHGIQASVVAGKTSHTGNILFDIMVNYIDHAVDRLAAGAGTRGSV